MAESQTPESIDITNLEDVPMEDAVREKLKGSKSVNILITGKHQVGKSTLINALFYKKGEIYERYAEEGHLEPTTKNISIYTREFQGISFNIYDTRGLQDGKGNDVDYIREMQAVCETVHLVIYCTKLDDAVRPEEIKALKNLTLAFGKVFWEKAVIAFTFANQVERVDPNDDEETFFMQRVKKKTKLLMDCFKTEKGLRIGQIIDDLSKRCLPTGLARKPQLPGIKDWRAEFWHGCLAACQEEGKGAILKLAWKNPLFVMKVVGNSMATTTGAAAVLGGAGAVTAGIALSATGVLLPLGLGLIIGGVIGAVLGVGSAAGGATGLAVTIKEFKNK